MSRIPKAGATVLQFVAEEALPRNPGWRPFAASWDQREAIAAMDASPSSYAQRVVQVVAVRIPPDSRLDAELERELLDLVGRDPEYAGDRYAEDFPRPRGVTP